MCELNSLIELQDGMLHIMTNNYYFVDYWNGLYYILVIFYMQSIDITNDSERNN